MAISVTHIEIFNRSLQLLHVLSAHHSLHPNCVSCTFSFFETAQYHTQVHPINPVSSSVKIPINQPKKRMFRALPICFVVACVRYLCLSVTFRCSLLVQWALIHRTIKSIAFSSLTQWIFSQVSFHQSASPASGSRELRHTICPLLLSLHNS